MPWQLRLRDWGWNSENDGIFIVFLPTSSAKLTDAIIKALWGRNWRSGSKPKRRTFLELHTLCFILDFPSSSVSSRRIASWSCFKKALDVEQPGALPESLCAFTLSSSSYKVATVPKSRLLLFWDPDIHRRIILPRVTLLISCREPRTRSFGFMTECGIEPPLRNQSLDNLCHVSQRKISHGRLLMLIRRFYQTLGINDLDHLFAGVPEPVLESEKGRFIDVDHSGVMCWNKQPPNQSRPK